MGPLALRALLVLDRSPVTADVTTGFVYVQGSGTEVTDWETTAYAGSATCTYANFWVNYVLLQASLRGAVRG